MRGQLFVHFGTDTNARLVGPCFGHVAWCVAPTAEHKEREAESLDEIDTGAMSCDVDVEAAQAVATERVGSTLDDDSCGVVGANAGTDDVFEEFDVLVVFDTVVEGHVERVVSAWATVVERSGVIQSTGAGEEIKLAVFMEG